jgi:acetoacetate decarboxylase
MLKGFNYPLTPKGQSTLNPRPPWYYSSDFLKIEFWAKPSAVAAVLPPGLDPDPAAKGRADALFYALLDGSPVCYCPYIFVDNDAALARGWTQGYPKRFGQVFQTRYYAATGKAGPSLAAGSKFAGSLTSAGQRLAEGLVELKEPVTDRRSLQQRPVINLLHTPRLAADKQDKPAVHELVENAPHDVKIEQAWIGEGSLTLPVCRGEEMSDLAPVRCGRGIRASMAYIVDDLKTRKDLRKP